MSYGEIELGIECALPRGFDPNEPRRRARRIEKGGSGHGPGAARALRQWTGAAKTG